MLRRIGAARNSYPEIERLHAADFSVFCFKTYVDGIRISHIWMNFLGTEKSTDRPTGPMNRRDGFEGCRDAGLSYWPGACAAARGSLLSASVTMPGLRTSGSSCGSVLPGV